MRNTDEAMDIMNYKTLKKFGRIASSRIWSGARTELAERLLNTVAKNSCFTRAHAQRP
jgi:hypothetical protein